MTQNSTVIETGAPHEASPTALRELAAIAERHDATAVAAFARAAADRVAEGRFFLACVGQFKRGKSTLINALVAGTEARAILPAGVAPVTSVPTVLRHGSEVSARVRFTSGEWLTIDPGTLSAYVSEDENPSNKKSVAGVEVFAPAPLLASGMNLVDTPGIGSVFAANTAATIDFLPHIDAALVVLGADPPISGEERALVAELAPRVSRMIFVLNKSDRVTAADSAAACDFTRRILAETLGHSSFDIFCVSALEQLESADRDSRDWAALTAALRDIHTRSGRAILDASNRRAAATAATRLLSALDNERRALTEPLADSEARIALLNAALAGADAHLADLGALLSVQERRITTEFAQRRTDFLAAARRACRNEFRKRAARFHATRNGPALRRALNHLAQDVVRAELEPFLARESAHAESAFAAANARFAELGNEFLHRLAGASPTTLDALSPDELAPPSLSAHSEYRFNFIERVAAPASPLRFAADLALGALGIRGPLITGSEEFLDQLLDTNSARIQNDLSRRVAESRRTLESAIRARLTEAAALGARSLNRARTAHAEGSAAIAQALADLYASAAAVRALQVAASSAT